MYLFFNNVLKCLNKPNVFLKITSGSNSLKNLGFLYKKVRTFKKAALFKSAAF